MQQSGWAIILAVVVGIIIAVTVCVVCYIRRRRQNQLQRAQVRKLGSERTWLGSAWDVGPSYLPMHDRSEDDKPL